jgi:hypothetical protein
MNAIATIPIPTPPGGAGSEQPEWLNLGFAVLALIALTLTVVWLYRRGRGPWR